MDKASPYYIGLDCGTNSVGWAVTDENYHLLKGTHRIKQDGKTKTKKQTLWGFRLFDEADTAAERRSHRSARRRSTRAKSRLKLLRMLFRDEIAKVDPEFYQRLRESFYYEEDKNLQNNSKNTLFSDPDFTDKDFHKQYPTIWHLRQAIIRADENKHFDIRLYFLAIQHILKHRGHFLYDGELKNGRGDFNEIFREFCDIACSFGFNIEETMQDQVKAIILADIITDKKKRLKDLALFRKDVETEEQDEKVMLQRQKCLCDLIAGGSVDLAKLFAIETDEKCSYSLAQLDEKELEIVEKITLDNMSLLVAAKRIYDYAILDKLLGDHDFISDAMVANYDQHKEDLKKLKAVFRSYSEIYHQLFKTEVYNEKVPSYNAYISQAYTEDKSGRRSNKLVSQEDLNKYLEKLLKEIGYSGKLLTRAENNSLLPKQRGQAKGTIPQQLHGNELKLILDKLQKDYPSFGATVPDEDTDYNTKAKKIMKIHSFRIPYCCGPLVKRKFDKDGNPVPGGKSQFSWADDEISELVYPWNFDKLVNKDQRAENFIRHMTNECTYLVGEDVLPKCALTYQKYMALNELNNLKINGQRIDNDTKQRIFERGYRNGELRGNVTLKKLAKWCKDNGLIGPNDELSGTSEVKILPKYQTYQDFKNILGEDFEKRYSREKLEKAIEVITILGEEKDMLERKLQALLGCSDEEATKLSKLSYKDWGTMSEKFLNGISRNNRTILDYLWEENKNLMELLGQDVGFSKVVEEYNNSKRPKNAKVGYQDVQNLYCSPAVKRSVWQTLKIVDELTKNLGYAPKKIFLEVTRGEDEKAKGNYTLARKKELETKLKAIRTEDVKAILDKLEGYEDRDLQSKKLFLYFSQMCKCAYSGETIDLEELNNSQLYDIDHIYPRSKTKDDSITRNLVLVKASLNREKTNTYPISDSIRSKMSGMWGVWLRAGLITKEKYERLVRSTPLTNDELGGFIARQLVETSQSVKAIRDLLERAYPETNIVMVKAGQVSEFRHLMSGDKKDRDGRIYEQGKYEFIKVREINDLHHAKDAYLNIVVGNVMNETFTSNPYEWIKRRDGKEYSIRPELLFRASRQYRKANGEETIYPEVRGWNFADSIKTVSDIMKRNDVIWTRMNYIESKEISDLQLVGKGENSDNLLKIKRAKRLDPKKYGGYNSLKGAHFALIECQDKKGNTQRRIVQIPIIAKENVKKYVTDNYEQAKVILPVIKYKSLIKLNGFPMHISRKGGETTIGTYHAKQLITSPEESKKIKSIIEIVKKIQKSRGTYEIDEKKDGVNKHSNQQLLEYLYGKLDLFQEMPLLGGKIPEIRAKSEKFAALELKEQCATLYNMLKLFACNAETGDLSSFVPKASVLGRSVFGDNVAAAKSFSLINQSPTGLYEERIDLKTVQPKE